MIVLLVNLLIILIAVVAQLQQPQQHPQQHQQHQQHHLHRAHMHQSGYHCTEDEINFQFEYIDLVNPSICDSPTVWRLAQLAMPDASVFLDIGEHLLELYLSVILHDHFSNVPYGQAHHWYSGAAIQTHHQKHTV